MAVTIDELNNKYDTVPTFDELKAQYDFDNDEEARNALAQSRWGSEGKKAQEYLSQFKSTPETTTTTPDRTPQTADSRINELKKDPQFQYKVNSIWDAYNDPNSKMDKHTRDYLILNSIATGLGNLGRKVGNVGAQFSGGAIDNTEDKSMWQSRNEEMLKQGISGEAAGVTGSEAEVKRLGDILALDTEQFQKYIRDNRKAIAASLNIANVPDEFKGAAGLYKQRLLSGEATKEDYIILTAMDTLSAHPELTDELRDLLNSSIQGVTGVATSLAGALNKIAGAVNAGIDGVNKIKNSDVGLAAADVGDMITGNFDVKKSNERNLAGEKSKAEKKLEENLNNVAAATDEESKKKAEKQLDKTSFGTQYGLGQTKYQLGKLAEQLDIPFETLEDMKPLIEAYYGTYEKYADKLTGRTANKEWGAFKKAAKEYAKAKKALEDNKKPKPIDTSKIPDSNPFKQMFVDFNNQLGS